MIAVLLAGVVTRVMPVQAQRETTALPTTVYGPNNAQVQAAVTASHWPQTQSNWCGIATIAAIAQFRGHATSQQDIANYLNSDAGVSEWGTPSSVPNEGPGVRGDIARDLGTDPRSLAASLANATQSAYHQYVSLTGNYDGTMRLVADLLRSNEPISVIVYHGLHSVLVSGVVATANPLTNPSSITGFEVWDPGVGVPNGNIQPDVEDFVSLSTWLNSQYYWGSPYDPNYLGSLALDPDPSVGPYTFDPAQGDNGHLWIGHYVYIRPDASTDAFTSVSPDWAFNTVGALIKGFHGEAPDGYTGAVTSIPVVTQLVETSFEAPALWTEASYKPVAASFAPAAVLSWVGTDAAHHLNVSVSNDGVHFTNKITLADTSFTRPSIIVVPNATNTANIVVMSWAGTDPNHSLNVMYDVYGARTKVTFAETSRYSPSLAYFNGQLWMSWTGTDAGHSVNVRSLGPKGLVLGAKTTLWGHGSSVTPALIADPQANQMLLSWQIAAGGHIDLYKSSDGTNWGSVLGTPTPQVSGNSPSLMAINPAPSDFPTYYLAWTGTDRAQSLCLQMGTTPNSWSQVNAYALGAIGGPVLGYYGQSHQIIEAFTGSNPGHNVSIAIIAV